MNKKKRQGQTGKSARFQQIIRFLSTRIYTCIIVGVIVVAIMIAIIVGITHSHKLSQSSQADMANNSTQQLEQNSSELISASNENQISNVTTIASDTTPPVITGVQNQSYTVGDKVSYLTDVYATDEVDGEIDVEVDKSEVNINVAGDYVVYYSATDRAGNTAKVSAIFTFTDPAPVATTASSYSEVVSQVIASITDPSMSQGAKAKAIYDYAHGRIGYAGAPLDGVDWQNEAYQALVEIQRSGYTGGDCFTYCSVDRALLEGIGAECIWVDNSGATTGDHSWLLCNLGTGYYHFDTTRMYDHSFDGFMLTDGELQAYINKGNSIYNRDRSAYPATPTQSYSY